MAYTYNKKNTRKAFLLLLKNLRNSESCVILNVMNSYE